MTKIHEHNFWYSILRPVVDHSVLMSYRNVTITGVGNIPSDGAVILAPNHCNTLMDALVVLASRPEATVFGARADVFKNPTAARTLRFLRILPMVRARDGMREVLKNNDTIDQITEVLEDGVKYCMFCEGTHRAKHSLMSVKKGIMRIAFKANERFGGEKPVYIVPIGLEYGDYFRFQTSVKISYGDPINVTRFLSEHEGLGEAELYKELGDMIHDGIMKQITYLPDDDFYDGRWALTKICGTVPSDVSEDLLRDAAEFDVARRDAGISFRSLGYSHMVSRTLLWTFVGLLLSPCFLYAAVASCPQWIAAMMIGRKVKDRAFLNTVRFGTKFALLPVMVLIWTLVPFFLLPWYWAAPAAVAAYFSNSFFYQGLEFIRVLVSDFRLCLPKNRVIRETYYKIKSQLN